METDYSKNNLLRCVVCGSDSHFEFNQDQTYVKCTMCNREYLGGYDELVELNQNLVSEALKETSEEFIRDATEKFADSLKQAFKGNKYIKFK